RTPLQTNLNEIQQKKNSLAGILAASMGVFPQTISFAFNLPECAAGARYDRGLPIALDYSVATGQITSSFPVVRHTKCPGPEDSGLQETNVLPSATSTLPADPQTAFQ